MRDRESTKSVLLINDMAGYGKVALSVMIPVLSHLRHQVFNLPTALVSNTLDYGVFDIQETTDYMRCAIAAWDELRFSFDAVATGFLVSEEQISSVLIGRTLSGAPLVDATKAAMDTVRDLLADNRDQPDTFKGIPIELYLDRIAPFAATAPASDATGISEA